jgi:hypothetical protein
LASQGVGQAGSRTVGYRLKETFRGHYAKRDFPNIDRVVKRLCQAGELPWDRVSDGSSVDYGPGGWESPEDFLRDAHELFGRDLRQGQPVVIEVGTEARETLRTSPRSSTGPQATSMSWPGRRTMGRSR